MRRKWTAWRRAFVMDVLPKGECIRRYGRWYWAAIPRSYIFKDGRRQFVAHQWLVMYPGEIYRALERVHAGTKRNG